MKGKRKKRVSSLAKQCLWQTSLFLLCDVGHTGTDLSFHWTVRGHRVCPSTFMSRKDINKRAGELIQAFLIHFLLLLLYLYAAPADPAVTAELGSVHRPGFGAVHTHGRRSLPCVIVSSPVPKVSCIDKGTPAKKHPHSTHLRRDLLESHSECRSNFQHSEFRRSWL